MDPVIAVEGLGKKFRLHHQAGGTDYATFRDILADSARQLAQRLTGKGRNEQTSEDEEFWALNDISFSIDESEKVGIIGRNGAGKSTLLKVISRILEPTRGKITIRGRVASLLEVGTGFHPELTGRENIFFNGSILGMTHAEIKSRFDEIVAFAEVEKFLDTQVKYYSSGMYVRLGFAVAAHLEPEILIIDEILAVGDAQFQKKCLGKLQEIGQQGRTVIFVSHNMSSILQFTNRVLLLQGGRIVQDSDSESGVRGYLKINEEVASALNLKSRKPWFRLQGFIFDQTRMEVGFNKPLRLRLEVEADRDLSAVEIMLPILNSIGARLITARTVLPILVKGSHTLNLEIPNHRLIPGTYLFSLTIREGDEAIFSQEQVISVELVTDQVDEPLLTPYLTRGKDRFGCFCPILVEGFSG